MKFVKTKNKKKPNFSVGATPGGKKRKKNQTISEVLSSYIIGAPSTKSISTLLLASNLLCFTEALLFMGR